MVGSGSGQCQTNVRGKMSDRNQEELSYLSLLKDVIENGEDRSDRTQTGVKSIFGSQLRFSLKDDTLPLLTSRRMFFRGIVEEMLLFLRGDCNTTKLEQKNIKIWSGNTSRDFLDKKGLTNLPEGNLGKGYPFQYRNFGGEENPVNYLQSEKRTGIDQIKQVLETLKTDPFSRRMLVSAWNPKQNEEAALPSCHFSFLFYVSDKRELSCQAFIRSSDLALGYGFNLCYYALITHLFAKASNMTAKEIIMTTGDSHIYNNLIEMVKEQVRREPYPFPKIKINKEISSIEDIEKLEFEDFKLIGYKYHPKLIGTMAI